MAVCEYCELEMHTADGCRKMPVKTIDGAVLTRYPYGSRRQQRSDEAPALRANIITASSSSEIRRRCHDYVHRYPGHFHHVGCDWEECLAITANCARLRLRPNRRRNRRDTSSERQPAKNVVRPPPQSLNHRQPASLARRLYPQSCSAHLDSGSRAIEATVTFYAQGLWSSGLPGTKHGIFYGSIFDGNQRLVTFQEGFFIKNGRFLTVHLPAGAHDFIATNSKQPKREQRNPISLEPGKQYFFRAQNESSGIVIVEWEKARLDQVSHEVAQQEASRATTTTEASTPIPPAPCAFPTSTNSIDVSSSEN